MTETHLRPSNPIGSSSGLAVAGIGWLVAYAAAGLATSLAFAVGAHPESLLTRTIGQLGLWAGFLGAPLIAWKRRIGPLADGLGFRLRRSDVLIGVLTGVGTQLLAIPLLYRLLAPIVDEEDAGASARDLVARAPGSMVVLLAVTTIVIAPVVEEIFWRGLLLRGLRARLPRWAALAAAALLFGATHFQLAALPGLTLAGLAFAWLADRSGRLGSAIVAHVAFNAVTIATLTLA